MTLPTRQETAPALLRALHELGGEAPARDAIPLVTDAFQQITTEDLALQLKSGASKWRNRVYWARQDLVDAGKIWSPQKGIWALTESGRREAASLAERADPLTESASEDEPPAAALVSSASGGDGRPPDDEDESAPIDDDDTPALGHVAVLPNEPDRIITELRDSATSSADPARLEIAIADALRFLGFDAKRIGGPGRTDVLAIAHLGVDRYAVVIDAKSTASGRVGDHQVDWDSITDHRDQERANYSCIVGSGFATGNLRERAEKHDTRLLTTGDLAAIVRAHADSPVSLKALRQLFDSAVDAATAVRDVQAASAENDRRRKLPLKLMQIIDRVGRDTSAVPARADSLWFALAHAGDDGSTATTEEIAAALALLEICGILRRSNGEGYVPLTSLAGATQMLNARPVEEQLDPPAAPQPVPHDPPQAEPSTDGQPEGTQSG